MGSPWFVTKSADEDLYKRTGPQMWVLEERITPETYERHHGTIANCYSPVYVGLPKDLEGQEIQTYTDEPVHPSHATPHAYWLRVDQVPDGERVRWTSVPEEINLREAEMVMQHIELYEWIDAKRRFIIRPARRAWTDPGLA